MAASPRFGGHGPLLCGLALTRIIGWGSTFYSPSVLVSALDRDIGLNTDRRPACLGNECRRLLGPIEISIRSDHGRALLGEPLTD